MFRIVTAIVFSIIIAMLVGSCAPAKYRGWSDGDKYFTKGNCHDLYRVKKGDSISIIEKKCTVSQNTIIRLNDLSPPYWLEVNQQLRLSSAVKPIFRKIPTNKFIWPLKNKKNYQFIVDRSGKSSLIIKAKKGTPIYAVAGGEVAYSGNGIKQFGNMVIIKHQNGYLSLYAHNYKNRVKEGQKVKKYQVIANMGLTGNATEPQLYFEVRYKGKKVDAQRNFR